MGRIPKTLGWLDSLRWVEFMEASQMEDDHTYTKVRTKQWPGHKKENEEEEQRLPGIAQRKKKETEQDGNHGTAKWGP